MDDMHLTKGSVTLALAAILAAGVGAAVTHGATSAEATTSATQAAATATAADETKVAAIYKTKCSVCHAMDGNSPLPNMSFADGVWKHGTTVEAMVTTISNGVPGTAMMPFKAQFTPEEIEGLARYVRKFDKKLK